MPEFASAWMKEVTGGEWAVTTPPEYLPGPFCLDSRKIERDQIFVALRTPQRDGHAFIADAAKKHAAAALVEVAQPEYDLPQLVVPSSGEAFRTLAREWRKRFTGTVVGITGSCGKTSTKDFLAHLLGQRCYRTEANLNNTLGVPLNLTRIDPRLHDYAVIEAGISLPGEMAVLEDMIQPDVGIVTNIFEAHIQNLGSRQGIASEKSLLCSRANCHPVFPEQCLEFDPFRRYATDGASVITQELPASAPSRRLRVSPLLPMVLYPRNSRRAAREAVLGEDGHPSNAFRYVITRRSPSAVEVSLKLPGEGESIGLELPPMSEGMMGNALLASAVALRLGVSVSCLQERLRSWTPSARRGQVVHTQDRMLYIDCYNASPSSMTDALEYFRQIAPPELPRLFVMAGMRELGERTAFLHEHAAEKLLLRDNDHAVFIGTEAIHYLKGSLNAGNRRSQHSLFLKRDAAQPLVKAFHGAHFYKGSRSYELEKLISTVIPTAPVLPATV